MSRPSNGRTARFEVRVTPEESAALFARMEEAGYKTISAFVRARLLDGILPTSRAPSLERAGIVKALTHVGERLNALARSCAHDEGLRVESQACLAALRETIAMVSP